MQDTPERSQQDRESVPGSRQPVEGSQAENFKDPVNRQGDVRRTDSGQNQQAEQQQMNAQAQQQAAQPAAFGAASRTPLKDSQGNEIPFYPAPAGHASASVTRNAQRAREQERTQAKVDLPTSATLDGLKNARYVTMPPGGLHALAETMWPDDMGNQDAMDGHIQDLLNLNRDTLRDDTSFQNGQMVRVPG